jgi:hypothetical protein
MTVLARIRRFRRFWWQSSLLGSGLLSISAARADEDPWVVRLRGLVKVNPILAGVGIAWF